MTATDREALRQQLIQHEGLRLTPYVDTVGKVTIGVGRNLTDVGLSREEALHLLTNDIEAVITDCMTFPWFPTLNAVRQRVICDMRFNLGPARLRQFRHTLAAVADGRYADAATGMLASRWATQVKGRARRLAEMMRTGQDDASTTLDGE